jgi:DNA-binding transcriptional LysR family regulator
VSEAPESPWLGVELRHLAALSAVAEEGSFRGAARRLGYVQSAISQQIAALERIVGATMVERERGSGSVSLSRAGRVMLSHAEGVLAQVYAARADLVAAAGAEVVRVGATHDVAACLLPQILCGLIEPFASGAIEIVERTNDAELVTLLHNGVLDLAFTELPLANGSLAHAELAASPWLLYGAPGLTEPTLNALAQLPLVGMRGSRAFGDVEARLRRGPGTPRVVFRADVWRTALALALASAGAALLPALLVPAATEAVPVDVGAVLPPFRLGMTWHCERRLPELAERVTEVAVRQLI